MLVQYPMLGQLQVINLHVKSDKYRLLSKYDNRDDQSKVKINQNSRKDSSVEEIYLIVIQNVVSNTPGDF